MSATDPTTNTTASDLLDPLASTINDDQVTYQTLTTLFENTAVDIEDIEQEVQAISTAQTTYTDYINSLNQFSAYEDVVQQRLNQLQTFIVDDANIDQQEDLMTSLETQMNTVTSNYADIVSANNTLTKEVSDKYNAVKGRIQSLASQSGALQGQKSMYTDLIAQKRAKDYVTRKYVLLSVNARQVRAVDQPIAFDVTGKTIDPVTGRYKLGYNVEVTADGQFTYMGTSAVSCHVNIEVLGTDAKPTFDKITQFTFMVGTTPVTINASKNGEKDIILPAGTTFSIAPQQYTVIRSMAISLSLP